MNIVFKNQMLADLYDGKRINNKLFRSNPVLIKKYQIVLLFIKSIENVSQLNTYPGFHYEKLKGNLNMYSSIRLNKKYRLIFREVYNRLDFVDTLEIIEISNHYS